MSNGYDAGVYGSYSVPTSGGYGDSNFGMPVSSRNNSAEGGKAILRRRNVDVDSTGPSSGSSGKSRQRSVVKNLDFMFPKVDTEYQVQTDRGGIAFVIACAIIFILCIAETIAWRAQNLRTIEHVVVDTSLGQRMQVNLNITFPALACVDVHVDVMDVAGDSQLDLDQTFITKIRLYANGTAMDMERELDTANKHRKQQEDVIEQIQKKPLPDDYCGPCFGAHTSDNLCCNTCDELVDAYKRKDWRTEDILATSEQCIREGKNKINGPKAGETKSITLGEGCNLVGRMKLNRVAGNFHIAMGEGIQRDGKHVHLFNPEETERFNSSHFIHHLSFQGKYDEPFSEDLSAEETPLNGVRKIVDEAHGTTGLFQYFIKIVPTTYVIPLPGGMEARRETNGFFFTERFRPLMKEYAEALGVTKEDAALRNENGTVAAQAGQPGKHAHHGHHNVKSSSILPGVFFIYEIYPFAVEVRPNHVPITHLLIRLMATVGGVFTIVQFVDSLLDKRKEPQRQHPRGRSER